MYPCPFDVTSSSRLLVWLDVTLSLDMMQTGFHSNTFCTLTGASYDRTFSAASTGQRSSISKGRFCRSMCAVFSRIWLIVVGGRRTSGRWSTRQGGCIRPLVLHVFALYSESFVESEQRSFFVTLTFPGESSSLHRTMRCILCRLHCCRSLAALESCAEQRVLKWIQLRRDDLVMSI